MKTRCYDLTFTYTLHNNLGIEDVFYGEFNSIDGTCEWCQDMTTAGIVEFFGFLAGAIIDDYRKVSFIRSHSMVLLGKSIPSDYVPKPFKNEEHYQSFKNMLVMYMTGTFREHFFRGLKLTKEENRNGYEIHQTIIFNVLKSGEIKFVETPWSIGLKEKKQ